MRVKDLIIMYKYCRNKVAVLLINIKYTDFVIATASTIDKVFIPTPNTSVFDPAINKPLVGL